MLEVIFPNKYDDNFPGHKSAIWIFYLICVMTVGRSLTHIFLSDGGAQSIATIPLDQFSADGSVTVISLFAFWGLSQLLLGFLFVLVAFRYKSMVPLMYVLILLEYLGRIGIGMIKPLVTESIPPGAAANLMLILLSIVGLILSMRKSATSIKSTTND